MMHFLKSYWDFFLHNGYSFQNMNNSEKGKKAARRIHILLTLYSGKEKILFQWKVYNEKKAK